MKKIKEREEWVELNEIGRGQIIMNINPEWRRWMMRGVEATPPHHADVAKNPRGTR